MSDESTQQISTEPPAQQPNEASPTQQLDALAEAGAGTSGATGASADKSMRNFLLGLFGGSLLVVIVAAAIELAAG